MIHIPWRDDMPFAHSPACPPNCTSLHMPAEESHTDRQEIVSDLLDQSVEHSLQATKAFEAGDFQQAIYHRLVAIDLLLTIQTGYIIDNNED